MKKEKLEVGKSELFDQFYNAVKNYEFDYDSFEQVSYWLSQFSYGTTNEDLQYFNAVINLIDWENPLVFAFLETEMNQRYLFHQRISFESGSVEQCPVFKTYKSIMDTKVFDYVFKDPIGGEVKHKIGIIMGNSQILNKQL